MNAQRMRLCNQGVKPLQGFAGAAQVQDFKFGGTDMRELTDMYNITKYTEAYAARKIKKLEAPPALPDPSTREHLLSFR